MLQWASLLDSTSERQMNFKTAAAEMRIGIRLDTRATSGICALIRRLKYGDFITPCVRAQMAHEMHDELKRRGWHSELNGHPIKYPTPEITHSVSAFGRVDIHNWDVTTEYGQRRLAIAHHLADWLENGGKNGN